ncbi:hypothetical protein RclHR1_20790003 [Rhizophagus clarus]|uniref:Uncharacterized protein n=1 Tax=Rhizophagus clarus TaxID=94130 RepID=A0A2Z6R539_9GLOM|nr:hypothetical protein RclHR1_20790003 [Rhizophagus clarus]
MGVRESSASGKKIKKRSFFRWFYLYKSNMSTASSADESDASRYSLSYVSKKRKTAKVESASAPKRRSQRIVSQNSDLTASLGSVC